MCFCFFPFQNDVLRECLMHWWHLSLLVWQGWLNVSWVLIMEMKWYIQDRLYLMCSAHRHWWILCCIHVQNRERSSIPNWNGLHFHHERFPSYLFTPVLLLIVMLFWSDVLGVVEEFEIVEVVHNWWRCCIIIMSFKVCSIDCWTAHKLQVKLQGG